MKPFIVLLILAVIVGITGIVAGNAERREPAGCMTGAFLADNPSAKDIKNFKKEYGKKPYLVMVFIEWGAFVGADIAKDVYDQKSALVVTWEPWAFKDKHGIDFDMLLAGGYDGYIKAFAARLAAIKKDVYLRFAHEPNGDWYPWSAAKIGSGKYIAVYRHVKDIFDKAGSDNVKWIFAVNWEDIPGSNVFSLSYPGDKYADYIGIDGYNWGTSQDWSKWMSFSEIFKKRYEEITAAFKQPVIISEFSSSSEGGDKRLWIEDAMMMIRRLKHVEGFVIFNVDKETDWSFPAHTEAGKEFRKQLDNNYFKEI